MRTAARARFAGFAVGALCLCFSPAPLRADRPYILLGAPDVLLSDQPRVGVEVFDPNAGGKSMGPTSLWNAFVLDTGAQGLVAISYAVDDMVAEGYQTCAVFDEMGVGGLTHPYEVSLPYDFAFAGTDGAAVLLSGVRLLSDANMSWLAFGGYQGIVGTPAIVNRVTSMDNTKIADWNYLQMGVEFRSSVPADTGHRYAVPLELRDFPPAGQRSPNDPLPTYGPLLFAPMELRQGAAVEANWLVVDTGAQWSMLSTSLAFRLGLDANGNGILEDDALEVIQVGGAAGTVDALVFEIDAFALQTDANVDLVWTDCPVLVVDIDPAIPGVLGCNHMVAGWGDQALGTGWGRLDAVHLDLLDANSMTGTMYVDVAAAFDNVIPAPPAGIAIMLGAGWLLHRRRRSH